MNRNLNSILLAVLIIGIVSMSSYAQTVAGKLSIPKTNKDFVSPFGVAFGEGTSNLDHFMTYINDLGIKRTKVSCFYWNKIEPRPGRYRWKEVDDYINQLQPGDKALLNVFTNGRYTNQESGKGATFKNERYKEEYRKFIVALVKHTNGKITYWQRDTEPASERHYPADKFEEYVETQKIFYEAVKSVQPDAVVIGVNNNGEFKGGEPVNAKFFDYVIHYGKNYFDMLDVRLYKDKYDIPMRVEWFRKRMKKYGYEKPIVCTEFGGPDPREFPTQYKKFRETARYLLHQRKSGRIDKSTPILKIMREKGMVPPEIDMFLPNTSRELEEKRNRIHFRDLIQRHIIILSSGVKEMWYWNLASAGKHIIFGKMRLLDPHGWKKLPSYYCYQKMIQHIGNVKTVKRIITENQDIYLFNLVMQNGDTKYIIWEKRNMFYGEEQPAILFKLNVGWKGAKITDVFGNEEIKSSNTGVLTLSLTNTPLYIVEQR